MFIDDRILSESEIEYLDNILTEIGSHQRFRDISSYKKPWAQLAEIEPRDALERLHIKGIFNEQEMNKTEVVTENGHEHVTQKTLLVGTIDPVALVLCWIVTIYHRSGKTLQAQDLEKMEGQSGTIHFRLKLVRTRSVLTWLLQILKSPVIIKVTQNPYMFRLLANCPLKNKTISCGLYRCRNYLLLHGFLTG